MFNKLCSSVEQAVSRSPPTAGVPSSRLGHSMWVSWWTKQSLGTFSSGFFVFPCHNFHSTISPHSSLLFSSFHQPPVMVHKAWSAVLAIHRPSIKGLHRISSLDPALSFKSRPTTYISLAVITETLKT